MLEHVNMESVDYPWIEILWFLRHRRLRRLSGVTVIHELIDSCDTEKDAVTGWALLSGWHSLPERLAWRFCPEMFSSRPEIAVRCNRRFPEIVHHAGTPEQVYIFDIRASAPLCIYDGYRR
ncbi:MAG: hypothetical protein ACLR8Y_15885 [Alistipes indistinctus]